MLFFNLILSLPITRPIREDGFITLGGEVLPFGQLVVADIVPVIPGDAEGMFYLSIC